MKKWNRVISILCIVAMMFSSIAVTPMGKTQAADSTWITLDDFGISDGTYGKAGDIGVVGSYAGNMPLVGTSFVFNAKWQAIGPYLVYGGNTGWHGARVALRADTDGNGHDEMVFMSVANVNETLPAFYVDSKTILGSEGQFVGTNVKMKIVTEPGTGSATKMSFYANDVYCGSFEGTPNSFYGNKFSVASDGSAEKIAIEAVYPEPEEVKKLTLEDFGIADGTYGKAGDIGVVGAYASGSTLTGTEVSFGVTWQAVGPYLVYGGNTGWHGARVFLRADTDGNGQDEMVFVPVGIFSENLNAFAVDAQTILGEGRQFVGTALQMKMVTEKVGASKVKISFYVNDVSCGSFEGTPNSYYGNKLSVASDGSAEKITLTTALPDITPDTKPEELRTLTTADFGITDDLYTSTKYYTYSGTETSVLNTTFRHKMVFHYENEGDFYICYGANNNIWDGIRVVPKADGTLQLFCPLNYGDSYTIEPAKANLTSFLDQEFELGIDLWESGDDAKFDLYINGVQYNDSPYVWTGAVKENSVGNNINLIIPSGNSIRVGEVVIEEPEKLPSDYRQISFLDYEIESGVYGYAGGDLSAKGQHKGSLDKTIFSGDMTFDNVGGYLAYAGGESAWHGIRFEPLGNGNIRVYEATTGELLVEMNPQTAGVTLVGAEWNLKISTLFVDNDVQFGIWVNDVLYNNDYIILNNYKDSIGNYLGIYCRDDGSTMKIQSETPEYGEPILPDLTWKEISFSSFGVKDGTYGYRENDLAVSGGYYDPLRGTSLNGTLFNGYVKFSGNDIELRYGGKSSAWEGLWLRASGKQLELWDGEQIVCRFLSEIAGTKLVDNTFNLKISIVYVDSDGDGTKDDVQLGVWFDDVLYKNENIYLQDFASKMGSLMGIYALKTGASLEVRSADVYNGIHFPMFGFTADYEKYLDQTGVRDKVYTSLEQLR